MNGLMLGAPLVGFGFVGDMMNESKSW